jgi:hypothetical protein
MIDKLKSLDRYVSTSLKIKVTKDHIYDLKSNFQTDRHESF